MFWIFIILPTYIPTYAFIALFIATKIKHVLNMLINGKNKKPRIKSFCSRSYFYVIIYFNIYAAPSKE